MTDPKNMPKDIARINKELQTQSKKKALIKNDSQDGIDATLSISAGQIQLNERGAQSPDTEKRSSAQLRASVSPDKAMSELQAPMDELRTENQSKVDEMFSGPHQDDVQSQLITN